MAATFACSLCGACSAICPVKIDLAHLHVALRRKAVEAGTPAGNFIETTIWKSYAFWMRSGFRFRTLMKFVKLGIRIAPFLPWHPDKLGQWTRGRALPPIPKEPPFRDWWKKEKSESEPQS